MYKKIKGTQDFLDLQIFNFIINQAKKHLTLYNFHEISTPLLEYTDLFKRSLGMQTDIVSKEMFIIEQEKKDEKKSICLRPEGTASTVRAFVENKIQSVPWKVYSWGPMFRHERPQKGRFRQFHQMTIEVIGAEAVEQDVQFIVMLDNFFRDKLFISDSALLINFLGCFEDRASYKVILNEFLEKHESFLCSTCLARKDSNIMRVFDCKNSECQKIYIKAPYITDYLCLLCQSEWQQIKEQLSLLSITFVHKPTLVRGLDYYNKVVFEFVSDRLGAQNAFCGGGRYNQLVGQIGGKADQSCIGAAFGVERLIMLLELHKNMLPLESLPALHCILPMGKEQKILALFLAEELQNSNLAVDTFLQGGSLKSMMRTANKKGAKYCFILGQDELENKTVTVKNMQTSKSETILQVDLVNYLK